MISSQATGAVPSAGGAGQSHTEVQSSGVQTVTAIGSPSKMHEKPTPPLSQISSMSKAPHSLRQEMYSPEPQPPGQTDSHWPSLQVSLISHSPLSLHSGAGPVLLLLPLPLSLLLLLAVVSTPVIDSVVVPFSVEPWVPRVSLSAGVVAVVGPVDVGSVLVEPFPLLVVISPRGGWQAPSASNERMAILRLW